LKLLLLVFSFFILSSTIGQNCSKSTIRFRSGKYHTNKKFLGHIDSVLANLNPDTTYLFEIHGHTDSNGTESENYDLAYKRIRFAIDYVREKKLSNIHIIYKNFGELSPVSDKKKLNRRVNIFTTPINSDGTIIIKGNSGSQMRVPYRYFNQCGYCLSHPELKSMKAHDEDYKKAYEVTIETDCNKDIKCLSVVFRFPYSQFNPTGKVKVPTRIFVRGCRLRQDSIMLAYYDKFDISYDSITDEYVVTHDCFNPKYCHNICGGLRVYCPKITFKITDTINSKRTSYYYEIDSYEPGSSNPTTIDSIIPLKDTNHYERVICRDNNIMLYGLGYYQGEILFMRKKIDRMKRVIAWDDRRMFDHYDYVIEKADYKPLEYLGTTLQIKAPRKIIPDSIGYYITELDYFISIEHFKRRRYRKALLDFTFDFGIYQNDTFEAFEYTELKKKYRKRRKLLKVKIKKKNIKKLNKEEVEQ